MPFKEIGLILLILMAVVIGGNLWFHLVESLLARIKGFFMRRKDPPPWHPLAPEQEDKKHD